LNAFGKEDILNGHFAMIHAIQKVTRS
jgi:hypothetical protein